MDRKRAARAHSFEQDLLWSVLDQDAVPCILEVARDHSGVDAAVAWAALREQAVLGRLRAYRGTRPFTLVDLMTTRLEDAGQDYGLFVEPTQATHARLSEIGAEVPVIG